jgi:hypothetical protein
MILFGGIHELVFQYFQFIDKTYEGTRSSSANYYLICTQNLKFEMGAFFQYNCFYFPDLLRESDSFVVEFGTYNQSFIFQMVDFYFAIGNVQVFSFEG